jgi:transcriptional regulator GlxA family with amidase domain
MQAMRELNRGIVDYLCRYVTDHVNSSDMTLKHVASVLQIPYRTASAAFRKATGVKFGDFVNSTRTARAAILLEGTSLPIKAIANEVGFSAVPNFYRAFKRIRGTTPACHRQISAGARGQAAQGDYAPPYQH